MFGKSKGKKNGRNKANKKLVNKLLGKDSDRPTFGFPCSPDISVSLKKLTAELHVFLYSLSEHALQLGAEQIARACEDPEEREQLRTHIVEVHEGRRLAEIVNRYDQEAADRLDQDRRRRFYIDQAVRKIVVKYVRQGLELEEIDQLIEEGIHYRIAVARRRQGPVTRSQDAVSAGQNPEPPATQDSVGQENETKPDNSPSNLVDFLKGLIENWQ